MKNLCYIHGCSKTTGIEILKDMINRIRSQKLYTELDEINISFLGKISKNDVNDIENIDKKIKIIYQHDNMRWYEFPTLQLLKNRCMTENEECRILYLHTKGVNNPGNKNIEAWRNCMLYFLVNKYETCFKILEKHDCCGINFKNKPFVHFQGNFWWSNSNHIKKLPNPQSLDISDRYNAEKWLLSLLRSKYYNLHNSHIDHYHTYYPSEVYMNGENSVFAKRFNYLNDLKKMSIINKQQYDYYITKSFETLENKVEKKVKYIEKKNKYENKNKLKDKLEEKLKENEEENEEESKLEDKLENLNIDELDDFNIDELLSLDKLSEKFSELEK